MGRSGKLQAELALPFAVRLVYDDLSGWLVMAAGQAPLIARVSWAKGVTGGYFLDACEGEWPNPTGTLWPSAIPRDYLGYPTVMVVPTEGLKPVDLLRILSGRRYGQGDATDGYYYWQSVGPMLVRITEAELRKALASRWVRAIRGDDQPKIRGIRLKEQR
jgi:hypothetical protein